MDIFEGVIYNINTISHVQLNNFGFFQKHSVFIFCHSMIYLYINNCI